VLPQRKVVIFLSLLELSRTVACTSAAQWLVGGRRRSLTACRQCHTKKKRSKCCHFEIHRRCLLRSAGGLLSYTAPFWCLGSSYNRQPAEHRFVSGEWHRQDRIGDGNEIKDKASGARPRKNFSRLIACVSKHAGPVAPVTRLVGFLA
jgi:hypothetical protein